MSQKLSTSALAKKFGLSSKALFQRFEGAQFIVRKDDKWHLTNAGKIAGGELKNHSKYGDYVAWPEAISLEQINAVTDESAKALSATQIGKFFNLPAIKVNYLLSELGWIEKSIKGWTLTAHGIRLGGFQNEDEQTGIPYVTWPHALLQNISLVTTVSALLTPQLSGDKSDKDYVLKAIDGHVFKSLSEQQIDDWLYIAQIRHACQRRLPIEQDVYATFYLPDAKVYIQYWDDNITDQDKERKKRIYYLQGFDLIELTEQDIGRLDDILPKQLLKFGVQSY